MGRCEIEDKYDVLALVARVLKLDFKFLRLTDFPCTNAGNRGQVAHTFSQSFTEFYAHSQRRVLYSICGKIRDAPAAKSRRADEAFCLLIPSVWVAKQKGSACGMLGAS